MQPSLLHTGSLHQLRLWLPSAPTQTEQRQPSEGVSRDVRTMGERALEDVAVREKNTDISQL